MKLSQFLLTAGAEEPLLSKLWYFFFDNYISGEAVYENLSFGGMISPQLVVIGLFLGLCAAGLAAVFNKRVLGGFVNILLSRGCLSGESALSLPELDCAHKLSIRYGVRRGVNLRRVVRCREEEEYLAESEKKALEYEKMREENPKLPKKFVPKPFKVDPDVHHFYIPEDMRFTAETKFSQKGNSWAGAVIYIVFMLAVLAVLLVFLPDILSFLDAFVGELRGNG